jgi:hypothetical protein
LPQPPAASVAAPPPLSLPEAQRYARQIALPEVGAAGQLRLREAAALVVAGPEAKLAAGVAADYLRAAGVTAVDEVAPPAAPEAWLALLRGRSLVVRIGFDDDALLRAAVRLGVPLVVARVGPAAIDLVAFRRHGPCPHADLAIPARPAGAAPGDGPGDGAAAVLAGTLAAAEALWALLAPEDPPRARLTRLPLEGAAPLVHELPWAPECFLCGGRNPEASLS